MISRGQTVSFFLRALTLFVALYASAQAQESLPPPPPPGQGNGTPSTIILGRSMWPEAAVTIAAMGLALFAICRNSRRN